MIAKYYSIPEGSGKKNHKPIHDTVCINADLFSIFLLPEGNSFAGLGSLTAKCVRNRNIETYCPNLDWSHILTLRF